MKRKSLLDESDNQAESKLIGLRSPVLSSMAGSTAIIYLFGNVLRFYEPFRDIAIHLVTNYSVIDNQFIRWFTELLLLGLCLLDSIIGSTTVKWIAWKRPRAH